MSILFRVCCACLESKPVSEFWKCSKRKDGYQGMCKVCSAANRLKWASENRNRVRAYSAGKKQPYGEKKREYHRRRYADNKDAILLANKAWWKNNPEKARVVTLATTNRRRVVKLGCVGSHTEDEWVGLCGRYERLCARCGQAGKLTRDHIIPLVKGGTDYISNIQPLCRPCNSSKGTKTLNYLAV